MTWRWSAASRARLDTCDPRLIELMDQCLFLSPLDMTIIEGHRSHERQDELFRQGKSKLRAGQSKHNARPSRAVDYAPLVPGKGVVWDDREMWLMHVGFVRGVAASLGIAIRVGADWNGNFRTHDQTFHDMPHVELI